MTVWQIVALLTLGPIGLILLGKFIQALMAKEDFHILQGLLLLVCVVVILITFIGVE